ncbi:MAG TPA: zinc-binding dehydrogenase [Acidimicrobiales bacterium]|jgi:threonine dehydrogenase-like Zn-dependent dehydrogenase
MKALLFERSIPRYAAARVVSSLGSGRGVTVAPLRLTDIDPPDLPGPGWTRVRPRLAGICGSDLTTLDGKSSRYFEPIVSLPFVPGHEVVGDVEGADRALTGRVVIEPVLGCRARGVDPPCPACAVGDTGGCERVAFGHLKAGLQTGYCADTGGGWSDGLVAHTSQLHPVPDRLSDEAAVMVEPAACAVHAALSAGVTEGSTVVVLGAGTLGLCTIAALRQLTLPGTLLAGAKHPAQRQLASALGADLVVDPGEVPRAVRRLTRSLAAGAQLTGGADVVLDCVGSADSIEHALSVVRPRGRVILVGMPGATRIDLTPLWHREISLTGAYAYGRESTGGNGSRPRTFELAFELVDHAGLDRLVSAHYPLERFQDAVEHAGSAGRRGATKVVFDLREQARWRKTGVTG